MFEVESLTAVIDPSLNLVLASIPVVEELEV